jgi:FtsH-binding integral membrane protein
VVTCIGLDDTAHTNTTNLSTSIGLWLLKAGDSNFTLASGGAAVIAFMVLSIVSFIATAIINNKQITVKYLLATLILVVVLSIIILTSKPDMSTISDKINN